MTRELLDRRERILIATEVQQFFVHPRLLHFAPLTVAGTMLVLWPYISSPFVAIFVVLFAGLEPQFSNILFRTPFEFESLSTLPIPWHIAVRAKNVATVLILLIMLPLFSVTLLYFSPLPTTIGHLGKALLYLSTIIFPLIHLGNLRSVQHPRRRSGWQLDDLAGMVELLIGTAILSIPYLLFAELAETPLVCIIYAVATVLFWWRYSIPKTADLIETLKTDICLTA